jgi:hypothetical protein
MSLGTLQDASRGSGFGPAAFLFSPLCAARVGSFVALTLGLPCNKAQARTRLRGGPSFVGPPRTGAAPHDRILPRSACRCAAAHRARRAGQPAENFSRRRARRRQDLRHAVGGARAEAAGRGRGGGPGGNARARRNRCPARRHGGTAASGRALRIVQRRRSRVQRVRSGCGAGAQAGGAAGGRAGAPQSARWSARAPLAGHRRADRRRHRGVHRAQRTAPGKSQRSGATHHRHHRARNRAGRVFGSRARHRADRPAAARADRAAEAGQGVRAGNRRRRAERVLLADQSGRAARTGAGHHRRPCRQRSARAHAGARQRHDRASARAGGDRRPRAKRLSGARGAAHRRAPRRTVERGLRR